MIHARRRRGHLKVVVTMVLLLLPSFTSLNKAQFHSEKAPASHQKDGRRSLNPVHLEKSNARLPSLFARSIRESPGDLSLRDSPARRKLLSWDQWEQEFIAINREVKVYTRAVDIPQGYLLFSDKVESNTPHPKVVVINYIDGCCTRAQYRNCASAVKHGADFCIAYNRSALSETYFHRNEKILSVRRGGGYWSWKPYLILKTLLCLDKGDFLVYSDAAQTFVKDIRLLLGHVLPQRFLFDYYYPLTMHYSYTKRDDYFLMGCVTNATLCHDSHQVSASFFIFQNCDFSLGFVAKWLAYAQDARVISDDPSSLKAELTGFIGHRHDQAIVSLLIAMYGLEAPTFNKVGEKEYQGTVYHHRVRF